MRSPGNAHCECYAILNHIDSLTSRHGAGRIVSVAQIVDTLVAAVALTIDILAFCALMVSAPYVTSNPLPQSQKGLAENPANV